MCKISNGSQSEPHGRQEKQALHPRVVPYGTIHTNDLIKEAEGRSGISGADIKRALQVIADMMAFRLDEGYNVELDGIGFFSVSLASRPVMDKKKSAASRSISAM